MTDGPYCPRCQLHRIAAHGQICPVCIDEDKRRTEHSPAVRPLTEENAA